MVLLVLLARFVQVNLAQFREGLLSRFGVRGWDGEIISPTQEA